MWPFYGIIFAIFPKFHWYFIGISLVFHWYLLSMNIAMFQL